MGGGAAGIVLAREFIGTPWRVVLLESGGLRYTATTQALYAGETIGLPGHALTYSRFRMFGGSTTRWVSQCRPLDPLDFAPRPGIPHSGWPFDHHHLERWYARAQAVCGLDPPHTDWAPPCGALPIGDDPLETVLFRFGYPRDFGRAYRDDLAGAANLDVLLNANVVEIEAASDLRAVRAVHVKTLAGQAFEVRARAYVLACGGIENARLLLASNRTAPAGLGNTNDLVGRFFMDHPYLTTGHFVPDSPEHADGAHVIRSFKGAGVTQKFHAGFVLREAIRREERLTGCSAYFIRRLASETAPEHFGTGGKSWLRLQEFFDHRTWAGAEVGGHLRRMVRGHREVGRTLVRRAGEVVRPQRVLAFRTILETTPCADSRVTLGATPDRLGVPRVRLDWRINGDDRRGLERLRTAMAEALRRRRLGRLIEDPGTDATGWPRSMESGKHHMGTTRMHADPRRGVVDPDGCIHGMNDLFVAGSSLFPTSGYANPTFTIVALTLRLADHLKSRLGR